MSVCLSLADLLLCQHDTINTIGSLSILFTTLFWESSSREKGGVEILNVLASQETNTVYPLFPGKLKSPSPELQILY